MAKRTPEVATARNKDAAREENPGPIKLPFGSTPPPPSRRQHAAPTKKTTGIEEEDLPSSKTKNYLVKLSRSHHHGFVWIGQKDKRTNG